VQRLLRGGPAARVTVGLFKGLRRGGAGPDPRRNLRDGADVRGYPPWDHDPLPRPGPTCYPRWTPHAVPGAISLRELPDEPMLMLDTPPERGDVPW